MDRPAQRGLVPFQGLVHRRVHLEQAAEVVGAAQGVDQRVGQRGWDARLALHLAAELDERRVVVGQAREAQVRRHEVQPLGPGVGGHLPRLEPEGRRGDLHRPRVQVDAVQVVRQDALDDGPVGPALLAGLAPVPGLLPVERHQQVERDDQEVSRADRRVEQPQVADGLGRLRDGARRGSAAAGSRPSGAPRRCAAASAR